MTAHFCREGLPVPREPAYAAKRSHDGEAPAAYEFASGRMPDANVRRRGTGSPEPASQTARSYFFGA